MKSKTSVFSVLFLLIIIYFGSTALTNPVSSKEISHRHTKESVQMLDIGEGSHSFKFQIGRDTPNNYLGETKLRQALETGQAQPRALMSDDFNGDGMADLVIGYSYNGGGILSVRLGNLEAIAPQKPEVLQGISEGHYPAPFLTEAKLLSLPEAPDFLEVGDFNADGYSDVLAAACSGEKLYLLFGNGRGRFKKPQTIELPGRISAMAADTEQLGRFTKLGIGLNIGNEAEIIYYDDSIKGFTAEPSVYPIASEATSLTFGRLVDDDVSDLAVSAGNNLAVIYGNENFSSSGSTEQPKQQMDYVSFSFAIKKITNGDFIFDRAHQNEIALLADDGNVYLAARGVLDTRPFSKQEKELLRQQHKDYALGKLGLDTLSKQEEQLVRRSDKPTSWRIDRVINSEFSFSDDNSSALLKAGRISNLPTEDLLIGDADGKRVRIIKNLQDAEKLGVAESKTSSEINAFETETAPLAAFSLRLSVSPKPGMVILQQGQIEPTLSISAPDAGFTVNSNVDLPDDNPGNGVCHASNGFCTLRAAVMESNHLGGSNSITLSANTTYTLTVGPFDDEFNAGGGVEESGDLDIIDLEIIGRPRLTAVSITGGNRDTTIIQMGTLSPAVGGINKDRILEVNDFVNPQVNINVTLSNLTMQNGVAPKTPAPDNYNTPGGAISYDGFDSTVAGGANTGVLTLTNCKITNNSSAGNGGGIKAGFGSVILQSTSIISANTASFASGGGVFYNGGNSVTSQTLQINNSTIGGALATDGNKANDTSFGNGGGVDAVGSSGVTVSNGALIQNNVAGETSGSNGGGGFHFGNVANISISNSTISNNQSKHHGGGIWDSARNVQTNAASTITLTTVTMQNNQADSDASGVGDGGGIYHLFGSMTLNNTSGGALSGNSAVNGGGIDSTWNGNTADPTAGLTVTSGTTINSNSAKNNGGGVYIAPGAATTFGTINITGATISSNTANSDSSGGGDGGGIFVSSGNINSLSGVTIDSNVANSGTGDGIKQTGGTITGAGTINLNGGDSVDVAGGTFTTTPGTFNVTGNIGITGGILTAASGNTTNLTGNFTESSGTFNGNNSTFNVNGNFTHSGGTFNGNTGTFNLTGNFSYTGGTFTANTGTFNFNGTAAQSIGASSVITFNNLTDSNTSAALTANNSINVNGNLTVSGANAIFAPVAAAVIGGTGTLTGTGTARVTRATGTNDFLTQYTITNKTLTNLTIDYVGAAAQGVSATAYNNLRINNASGASLSGAVTVNGALTLQAGNLAVGTNTLTLNGAFILSGGSFSSAATGTVNYNQSSNGQVVLSGNYGNLTFSNFNKDLTNATVGIAGAFTPGSGTHTITGSTFIYNGTAAQTLPSGFTTYNNLTLNNPAGVTGFAGLTVQGLLRVQQGTFTSSSTYNNVQIDSGATLAGTNATTINVTGNWTNNGTFTANGNTVNFNGSAAQTIGGSSATTFNNLIINNAAGVSLGTSATVGGALTLTAGTLAVGSNTLTLNGAATAVGGNLSSNATGTVNYAQSSNGQTVLAANYGNLTFSNFNKTLPAGTIGIAGAFTPGTATGHTITGSTIDFNGAGAQSVAAFSYNNLTISAARGGATVTLANGTINVGGAFSPTATGVGYSTTGNTFVFNGAGAQTIPAFSFNNLSTGGGGTKTLGGAVTVGGNLTIGAGTTLDASASNFALNIGANWINNGTFTPQAGTVVFNGLVGQSIGGSSATTFNNLTINNAAGVSLSINAAAGGALTLTDGILSTGANTLTLLTSGTTSRGGGCAITTCFVTSSGAGGLKKQFNAATPSFVFTVGTTGGTDNGYSPVSLANVTPTGTDDLTVQAVDTASPAAIMTPKITRYWALTGLNLTADISFTYLDGDITGTDETKLRVYKETANQCGGDCVVDATNTGTVTGVSSFSNWTLAEVAAPTAASTTLSGRITSPLGRGLSRVRVVLAGGNLSEPRYTQTNTFGYYRFAELPVGETYILSVQSKQYQFAQSTRVISLMEEISNIDFTGEPYARGDSIKK